MFWDPLFTIVERAGVKQFAEFVLIAAMVAWLEK